MRMVEEAAKLDTDQVREVTRRGRELGLKVFPSLKVQDVGQPGAQRCGLLKWEEGSKVCLGVDGRNEWAYDFALESVRENKLAIVREILGDYEADGIELDFMFGDAYFKPDEADAASIMSRYMSQIRSMAREIGDQQDREIPIMVRVCLEREDNLAMGLDGRPSVSSEIRSRCRRGCPRRPTRWGVPPTIVHRAGSTTSVQGCSASR